jgi:DNA primase
MIEWYSPVLDRLDKVRQLGTHKWTACCPVHDDSNPSMSVSL